MTKQNDKEEEEFNEFAQFSDEKRRIGRKTGRQYLKKINEIYP